jgi:hypothetical protein
MCAKQKKRIFSVLCSLYLFFNLSTTCAMQSTPLQEKQSGHEVIEQKKYSKKTFFKKAITKSLLVALLLALYFGTSNQDQSKYMLQQLVPQSLVKNFI